MHDNIVNCKITVNELEPFARHVHTKKKIVYQTTVFNSESIISLPVCGVYH